MCGHGEGDDRPHRPWGGPHGTFPLGKTWVLEIFSKDTAYCNWIIKKGIALLFIPLRTETWGSSGFAGWPSFKCRSPGSTLRNSRSCGFCVGLKSLGLMNPHPGDSRVCAGLGVSFLSRGVKGLQCDFRLF